jgi:hypothetical protein
MSAIEAADDHAVTVLTKGAPDVLLGRCTRMLVGDEAVPLTDEDRERIVPVIREFSGDFGLDPEPLINADYTRIVPASARPFAGKYTWE